jgi:hypothetical protein
MEIEVGPVPAPSALAWIGQARAVLELIRSGSLVLPFALPPDVLGAYEGVLDAWWASASLGPDFRWAGEMDGATLHHLVQYWVNLVQYLVENADGHAIPLMPIEAIPFRDALVPAITRALAADPDRDTKAFGERTSDQWPGLHLTAYPYGKAAPAPPSD